MIDKIKRQVEISKNFPNPIIEYNIDKLPKGVKKDDFYGVKARFNPMMNKDDIKVTYKLS